MISLSCVRLHQKAPALQWRPGHSRTTEPHASVLPPCFAPSSRTCASAGKNLPFASITAGQRRRSLAERFGAALRGHFPPRPPRFAPTVRNSLCRTSLRTFPSSRLQYGDTILQQLRRNVNIRAVFRLHRMQFTRASRPPRQRPVLPPSACAMSRLARSSGPRSCMMRSSAIRAVGADSEIA